MPQTGFDEADPQRRLRRASTRRLVVGFLPGELLVVAQHFAQELLDRGQSAFEHPRALVKLAVVDHNGVVARVRVSARVAQLDRVGLQPVDQRRQRRSS